jgi:hypothetical protein
MPDAKPANIERLRVVVVMGLNNPRAITRLPFALLR